MEFLDESQLPTDPKLWASNLNPDLVIKEEDVKDAIKKFQELGCKNIREYLTWYLKVS